VTTRDPLERYATQIRVERVGREGQELLGRAAALVVGVGALGSSIAHQLVRGGVGKVTLIDGDRTELGNLHRQILYSEADARQARPKAEAAREHLSEANSSVTIESVVGRLDSSNAQELVAVADVVVDGTDNLRTRFLLNDRCAELGVPWVYGGVAATHGMVLPVLPGRTACLRCLFDEPAPDEPETSTAETLGVFGPTPAVVGALEAAAAIRILVGDFEPPTALTSIDVWTGECDTIVIQPSPGCPSCAAAR